MYILHDFILISQHNWDSHQSEILICQWMSTTRVHCNKRLNVQNETHHFPFPCPFLKHPPKTFDLQLSVTPSNVCKCISRRQKKVFSDQTAVEHDLLIIWTVYFLALHGFLGTIFAYSKKALPTFLFRKTDRLVIHTFQPLGRPLGAIGPADPLNSSSYHQCRDCVWACQLEIIRQLLQWRVFLSAHITTQWCWLVGSE